MPRRGENIHKRKDGRWEGRYKTESNLPGKTVYRSVYGKTYTEVKRKMTEIIQKQRVLGKAGGKKLGEVLRLWEEANSLKHKGATEARYHYLIEKHILPELGDMALSSLTTRTLNKFAERKLTEGRLDKKGGLSPAYVRSIMVLISSALQYAIDEGYCFTSRPFVYKPPIEKKKLEILSPQEQEKFERFLLSDLNQTNLGIILSLNCGLRIGEICALKWEDIDLKNKVIRINNTVARVQNKDRNGTKLIVDKPKTKASLRDVPIHSKLIPIITKAHQNSTSPYVVSCTGQFTSPRTFEYRYHQRLQQCGLNAYNYHVLRHTFATKCIFSGVDVKTLSEILGHANVSITLNTYVHPSTEMKSRQIEKIAVNFA